MLKYFAVFTSSMFKFIAGPVIGKQAGLSFLETCLFTTLGMITSSVIIMYGGEKIWELIHKASPKNKKTFSKKNRRIVKVWSKFGIKGLAFLTPILLSPVGGPIIASLLEVSPKKTIQWMVISGIFWSPITVAGVYWLSDFFNEMF
ncbi:MAG: hypothetical protein AB8B61_03470 [Cyclobacteriaceae bacterium]